MTRRRRPGGSRGPGKRSGSRGSRGKSGAGSRAASAAGSEADRLDRVAATLARAPAGLHHVAEPAPVFDAALPDPLRALYLRFDGASLFHESLVLLSSADVMRERREPAELPRLPVASRGYAPGTTGDAVPWRFGELHGDDLYLAADGAVWRLEKDTGEWLEEGTGLARWLLAAIEAEAESFDEHGEFRDLYDDAGELLPAAAAKLERVRLDRDPRAPAPRWRLARALSRLGQPDAARRELERVVADRPRFAWAWYDLARISEQRGEVAGALDEMCEAAEGDHEHAAYFLAHAARLAARLDDESRRAQLAARARDRDPGLAHAQRDGARACLAAGDLAGARELAEVARALAPRDLSILDLLAQLRPTEPPDPPS